MTIKVIKSTLAVSIQGFMAFLCIVVGMMVFYSLNVSKMDIVTIAVLPGIFACGVMHSYSLLAKVSSFEMFKTVGMMPWVRVYGIGMGLWIFVDAVSYLTIGHSIVIPSESYDPKSAIVTDFSLYCAIMSLIGWTLIPRIVVNNESLLAALRNSNRDLVGLPWFFHAIIPTLCLISAFLSPIVILLGLFFIFPFITLLAFPKYLTTT